MAGKTADKVELKDILEGAIYTGSAACNYG